MALLGQSLRPPQMFGSYVHRVDGVAQDLLNIEGEHPGFLGDIDDVVFYGAASVCVVHLCVSFRPGLVPVACGEHSTLLYLPLGRVSSDRRTPLRGNTKSAPEGRGVEGRWTLVVQELDPDQDSPEPSSAGDRLRFSAPAPVKGQPRHPALGDRRVPARVHASWTRHDDGLVVEMAVDTTTDGRGPVAEWFLVRPVGGVSRSTRDYRLPIPTMAKLAVTEWGYPPEKGIDIDDRRLRHERNEQALLDKLAVVARSGDAAKARGVPMVPAVRGALAAAGYPSPAKGSWSKAYIYKLRSQARALGLTEDAKEAS